MQEYDGPHWVLNLPERWNGHHGTDSDTIFYQDGVGVVDISSLMNDVVAKEKDLLFYASEYLEKTIETSPIQLGDFSGFYLEYDKEGDFWWRAFLKSGHVLIFISYNCKSNEKHLELEAVQEILQSLSVKWDI